MNKKIFMNLKIEKKDYFKIKVSIIDSIKNLKQTLNSDNVNDNDKQIIRDTLNEYKNLLSKLEICELYNFESLDELYKEIENE